MALRVIALLVTVSTASVPFHAQTDGKAVVLRNLRVIDGTGSPPALNQTIVIEGARLSAVGDASQVKGPAGATELDLTGRTALPGLVMMHEHLIYMVGLEFSHALPFSAPRLYLAFGITTIRTAGTDHPYLETNLKRAIERGDVPGPEIHLTSPYFNGPGSPTLGDLTVSDPDQARASVRYWAAQGISWFKVYTHISKPVLAAVIDEAHKLGARVTGHLESVSCADAAELGIDNIEHSWGSCRGDLQGPSETRAARAEPLMRKLIAARVTLTSTPVDLARPLTDQELSVLHPAARDSYLRLLLRRGQPPPPGAPSLPPRGEGPLTLQFVKAGGRIVLGSDPCCDGLIPGFASHNAIKLLAEAGFTPLDAIRIATLEGARFLGIADRVGTIAVGKEADLLIVRGDPATNIQDLSNVERVYANGKAYDPQALLSEVRGQVGWR
jgi:imidazolonepropionase-like amidohydrolase